MVKIWVYKMIPISGGKWGFGRKNMERRVNSLASEGWRVVAMNGKHIIMGRYL